MSCNYPDQPTLRQCELTAHYKYHTALVRSDRLAVFFRRLELIGRWRVITMLDVAYQRDKDGIIKGDRPVYRILCERVSYYTGPTIGAGVRVFLEI